VNLRDLLVSLIGFGVLCLVGACDKREPVSTYQAPKEPQTVTWTVPPSWQALPFSRTPESGGMKVAGLLQYGAFAAGEDKTSAAQVAVTTVFPDAPMSRDLLPNINRWRKQLGLAPIEAGELPEAVRTTNAGGTVIQWADFSGADGRRMRGAIVPREDRIWFFKMTGAAAQVEAQKDNFDAFVKSAHYLTPAGAPLVAGTMSGVASGGLPAGHPPMPGTATTSAGSTPTPFVHPPVADAAPAQNESGLKYTLPQGWSELPNPSPMRIATLSTGGEKPAQVIISRLSANFGGMLANINRWRGDVGLGPIDDPSKVTETPVKVGSASGVLVDFSGPGKDGSTPTRSLVARCTQGESVWFFKILGPAESVSTQRPAFEQFLASVKLPG
jgi:hypothetical protein